MVLVAITLSWLIDRGRLQRQLKEADESHAKLAKRLDSTERYSNAVQRQLQVEHNWLREHHPEVVGLPHETPDTP